MIKEEIAIEIKQLISNEQAWHYRILPQERINDFVTFLTDSKDVRYLESEIEVVLGIKAKFLQVEKALIDVLLSKHYQVTEETMSESYVNNNTSDVIMALLQEAVRTKCSDVHFEPFQQFCRIRFRLDGELKDKRHLTRIEYMGIVNRIKILANLDISEKRLPQDGRINLLDKAIGKLDVRVSVVPTILGEKVVLRLLGQENSNLTLTALGFSAHELESYSECLKKTKGIILISGPTGSGKTTTLYATLKTLNTTKRNILTIEDPVEYTIEGINQVQAKEDIGLTFGKVLRSFLRQDPDIIMLGEIRDEDTAKIAVRLALTGHLVLSTIHTNSAWGTISRLVDMGVPPYLLADTLIVTMAQRLVKKLCNHCKEKRPFDKKFLPSSYETEHIPSYHSVPIGCHSCYHTGYSGRLAIYELIPIDNTLRELVKINSIRPTEISNCKFKNLKERAFEIFVEENTSLEEIYPILMD